MKFKLKSLSLLLWVTQFGLSVLFPICCSLVAAAWLQRCFDLGVWIVVVLGSVGLLSSTRAARSCIRAMLKEAEKVDEEDEPPVSFNDHL